MPWWVETEGKKRVVPKVKLKKDLGVKSHNLADAVIAADNSHAKRPMIISPTAVTQTAMPGI